MSLGVPTNFATLLAQQPLNILFIRKYILCSLLCLLSLSIFGQFEHLSSDSLQLLIAQPPDDTTELAAAYVLYNRLYKADAPEAGAVLSQLIHRAEVLKNNFYLGEGYRRFSFELINKGAYDSCILMVQLAQETYQKSDDPRAEVKYIGALVNEGVYRQVAGEHDNALETYNKARELALAANNEEYLSKILNNMAVIFRRLNRTESAAKTYREAIVLKEKMKDSLGIANSLYNLGTAEMQLEDSEAALKSFSRSRDLYLSIGDSSQAATVDIGIGGAYYNSNQFEAAKRTWLKAINTPGIQPTLSEAISLYLGLGDIHLKDKEYDASLEMLNNGLELVNAGTDAWVRKDLYGALGHVNYELGNFEAAANYYRQFRSGIDTLYDAQKLNAAQEMSEKYEAELRDAEIERQELVIESQNARTLLLGIGAAALAVLALGIFLLYRSRLRYQRSENVAKMLKKEQEIKAMQQQAELNGLRKMIEGEEAERHRVAKDLHDGLGGMLSSIKTRISIANAPAAEAADLLDRACKEVRRIAHNMVPQSLALSGLEGSLRDIRAQLQLEGLNCELEIIGQPELRLGTQEQSMLLRITQELTHNIVKHAEAKNVFIQLLDQPHQLLLTIEDDGKGFNADIVGKGDGLGLSSINSRASYLKGEVLFDTSPGRGTTVTLNIPL